MQALSSRLVAPATLRARPTEWSAGDQEAFDWEDGAQGDGEPEEPVTTDTGFAVAAV
jgi:hypothetical protein